MYYVAYQLYTQRKATWPKVRTIRPLTAWVYHALKTDKFVKRRVISANTVKEGIYSKKNGKKRPLGIPAFNDKLLQEVVRMILEAIYEGSFDMNSHGFRPKRSCHTALRQIQRTFNGARWFIEGDIKGFFDNIDHGVMISILENASPMNVSWD